MGYGLAGFGQKGLKTTTLDNFGLKICPHLWLESIMVWPTTKLAFGLSDFQRLIEFTQTFWLDSS